MAGGFTPVRRNAAGAARTLRCPRRGRPALAQGGSGVHGGAERWRRAARARHGGAGLLHETLQVGERLFGRGEGEAGIAEGTVDAEGVGRAHLGRRRPEGGPLGAHRNRRRPGGARPLPPAARPSRAGGPREQLDPRRSEGKGPPKATGKASRAQASARRSEQGQGRLGHQQLLVAGTDDRAEGVRRPAPGRADRNPSSATAAAVSQSEAGARDPHPAREPERRLVPPPRPRPIEGTQTRGDVAGSSRSRTRAITWSSGSAPGSADRRGRRCGPPDRCR